MSSQLKAELTADASQFTAEMAKATKANQDFMTVERLKAEVVRAQERAVMEAQSAAAANGETVTSQQVSQINRYVKSLTEQSQRLQYTRADMRDMRTAQLGISSATADMRTALAQAEAATEGLGHGAAGARKEMLVLAHEAATGSWSNFGGSLLVLGERMDAMKYLMNPVALGLAAIGVAAYGAYNAIHGASDQFDKFNRSLALTDNWANLTNDTAAALAQTVAGDVGTSFQSARAAVDAAAASGKVLGEDMQSVTELALLMAKSTGESFDKALDSVLRQQDGVSKAADDWQSAHHDMDAATLEHIKSLDAAGQHTTALRILYAQELETMKKGTDTQVGSMTAVWNAFLDQWGRFKRRVAGSSSLQDQRQDLVDSLNSSDTNPGGVNTDAIKKEIAAIDALIAAQQKSKEAQDGIQAARDRLNEADDRANKLIEQGATNEQKRTKAIKEANDAYAQRMKDLKAAGYSDADIAKYGAQYAGQRDSEIANAQRMYADPKQKHAKAVTDDAATRMLQEASQTQAALQQQLDTNEKIGAEQEKQVKFEQLIADLKTKKVLTADQKSLLANSAQIDAALRQNTELEKQAAQQEKINKLKEAAAQVDADIANFQQSQSDQYQRQLSAIGLGSDAQKQADQVRSIYKKYQDEQDKLNKTASKNGLLGSDQYKDESAKIQAGLKESLQDYSNYYAELQAKQSDWVNGASAAVADYVSDTANKMKQTEQLFSDVTGGMEDAWVNFAQTGKLNFTSLANSVIADLARMQAKAAISGLFGSLTSVASGFFASNSGVATSVANSMSGDALDNLTSITGGWGTIPGHATGGVLSGPGTGTSDSILARVSAGEGILTADTVKRLGGASAIDALNRGGHVDHLARFATGGVVGAASSISPSGGSGISFEVVNNSNAQVQQPQVSTDASGRRFIRMVIDQAKSEIAGDIASGQGDATKALTQRYGMTPRFR